MTNTIVVTAGEPVAVLPASVIISATAEAEAAANEAVVAVEIATLAPIPTVTAIPTQTPTSEPTATALPTDTPAPISYTVVQGDAAEAIAARFGLTLDDLLLANNLSEIEATLLQPGQTLVIPLPGAGTGTSAGALYSVRQGDTLVEIAARTGVSVAALQSANQLSDAQAASLQPGDRLVIPGPTATATVEAPPTATPLPTATVAPTAAPTTAPTTAPAVVPTATAPASATAAPTVAASAPNGMRHPAPTLRSPQDGATIACDAGRLEWNALANMEPEESYRIHLGFVSGRNAAGNVQITWIIQQDIDSSITQVGIPADFCDKSSDAMGNQWRWYVEAVAKSGATTVPVSPTSDVWGFTWKG